MKETYSQEEVEAMVSQAVVKALENLPENKKGGAVITAVAVFFAILTSGVTSFYSDHRSTGAIVSRLDNVVASNEKTQNDIRNIMVIVAQQGEVDKRLERADTRLDRRVTKIEDTIFRK